MKLVKYGEAALRPLLYFASIIHLFLKLIVLEKLTFGCYSIHTPPHQQPED